MRTTVEIAHDTITPAGSRTGTGASTSPRAGAGRKPLGRLPRDEWQQRRKPYAEWARLTVGRTTFAPWASPLAFEGDRLVGAVLSLDTGDPDGGEGYVERVAVRRDHRDRGIARLLLREAFRAFYLQGRRSCVLWTHSDTGALALYERIGMTVRRSSTVYGKPLVAG